jgi:hypothetical protein
MSSEQQFFSNLIASLIAAVSQNRDPYSAIRSPDKPERCVAADLMEDLYVLFLA